MFRCIFYFYYLKKLQLLLDVSNEHPCFKIFLFIKKTLELGNLFISVLSTQSLIIFFYSMTSKPITICLIRTGSQQDWKIMYSIELQTIFYGYQNKNHKIITRFVSPGLLPLRSDKTVIHFHFVIRGKLYIIRCDKYIFYLSISFTYLFLFFSPFF